MTESTGEPKTTRRICPTCGSRISSDAARCVVCGAELRAERRAGKGKGKGKVQRRAPQQVTLSLPVAIGVLAVFVLVSAGGTYAAARVAGGAGPREPSPTASLTPTITNTAAPTFTETPAPTPTPLPPIEITLPPNFFCVDLAAFYDVSLNSILQINPGLRCDLLNVGQTILIPQPTPTPAPPPTETLSPEDATAAACETVTYEVQEGEALSAIADNYNVSMEGIIEYNSMTGTTVYAGQRLVIPLCFRNPTPGPTPTATAPPPYPAPNLLLPLDGAAFTLANDSITLQWAAVAQLRPDEYYQVTVEDVTEGSGTRRLVEVVTDTKYIVPLSFRPVETVPHILRWWVTTVRQTGSNDAGDPIYVAAGAISIRRDFTWSGSAAGPTPTP
jgi:LysM repeat protein